MLKMGRLQMTYTQLPNLKFIRVLKKEGKANNDYLGSQSPQTMKLYQGDWLQHIHTLQNPLV